MPCRVLRQTHQKLMIRIILPKRSLQQRDHIVRCRQRHHIFSDFDCETALQRAADTSLQDILHMSYDHTAVVHPAPQHLPAGERKLRLHIHQIAAPGRHRPACRDQIPLRFLLRTDDADLRAVQRHRIHLTSAEIHVLPARHEKNHGSEREAAAEHKPKMNFALID